MQNEANLAPGVRKWARQLALGGLGRESIVQNKANVPRAGRTGQGCRYRLLWGQTCETNPIWLSQERMLTAEMKKSYGRNRRMTTMGKRSQFTASRQAEPSLGPTMRNEPNFCQRGRSCETKPIPGGAGWVEARGKKGVAGNRAKRSQFGPRCPEMGARRRAPGPRPRADCAKRSQSGESLECEASNVKLENPASSPPGLPTSNFTLQASNEPPYGVTTSRIPVACGAGWCILCVQGRMECYGDQD